MITWKDIIGYCRHGSPPPNRREEKTTAEWRKLLKAETFRITRQHGTEAPHSGALCSLYEPGEYHCACCNTPLFNADIKFNSGSGWPSFTQPLSDNAIKYVKDNSLGMLRVEVLCNSCDAHLGHVFPDGPQPSGLRYCINSAALQFASPNQSN